MEGKRFGKPAPCEEVNTIQRNIYLLQKLEKLGLEVWKVVFRVTIDTPNGRTQIEWIHQDLPAAQLGGWCIAAPVNI